MVSGKFLTGLFLGTFLRLGLSLWGEPQRKVFYGKEDSLYRPLTQESLFSPTSHLLGGLNIFNPV